MRRQRKHRHHPDIWRERHLAEKLGGRRWRRPVPAVFNEADFVAFMRQVWLGMTLD